MNWTECLRRVIECKTRGQKLQLKNGQRFEQNLHQRRYTDGQEALKKMLNIMTHQGNVNEDHNEVPPTLTTLTKVTIKQNKLIIPSAGDDAEQLGSCILLVGIQMIQPL